ncbi:MAG: VWA domain-containing protein [Candidatus Nealsonbacteria bacterium]|nr:VWA domain-containing protein [Candidatus Nealsonbacteria bacterium]
MSYSDESYRRTPTRSGGSFFKPTPVPPAPPPAASSKPPTRRASQARPLSVKIEKPKGKINLVFASDVTGSMGGFRRNVREKMEYFCDEIKNLLPELVGDMEISFVGVGDHCDGSGLLQPTAFSADVAVLKDNIGSIVDTHGGDTPEAYECLFKAMNSWDIEGTNTVLILVGDSVPHGIGCVGDDGCPDGVNWKTELDALKKKLKAFYLISCSGYASINRLQQQMVEDKEHLIELGGNFTRLTNIVHGIIAKEVGEVDKYLAHLAQTRGSARANEVATLLKTQQTKQ